jgi:hypothetical protein
MLFSTTVDHDGLPRSLRKFDPSKQILVHIARCKGCPIVSEAFWTARELSSTQPNRLVWDGKPGVYDE